MRSTRIWALASLAAVVMLTALLFLLRSGKPETLSTAPITLYCAAGIKPPVEEAAREYEKLHRVPIRISYGGSGTLLSNLRVTQTGDLFLAAEESYIEMARTEGLVREAIPLATMIPVIAVAKGNPKGIRSVEDLLKDGTRCGIANPDAAAIGKVTRDLLAEAGLWEGFQARVKVFKPTVNDLANDVKIGAIDAAIVWDAVVGQYPELEAVHSPVFEKAEEKVVIGVLSSAKNPSAALRFARYLGARDRGLLAFEKWGYSPVEGDIWEEHPELILFSGGVNRIAIEDTLAEFERREGARVTRVYNGCGILVAQMRAGEKPDAYFACDNSFVNQVQEFFEPPVGISETDMVILTPKGNPKGIHALADLSAPDLRLGVANAEQSALGALTQNLLEREGLLDSVMANVKTQTPTADLLVNQMRAGALDAVIVYMANTSQVRDSLEIIPITLPGARAAQPYVIGKNSTHKQLAGRLLEALRSAESKARFESSGFFFVGGEAEQ
ncbi:MAG: substrate-binding domain-containing protein [Candidatus Omnitrophica bacterium]|nr:hypothetical protein [bacterium]NUN96815.1 substrate-binding domain-containing protein [Candidatus Omnitrophota bacterium]